MNWADLGHLQYIFLVDDWFVQLDKPVYKKGQFSKLVSFMPSMLSSSAFFMNTLDFILIYKYQAKDLIMVSMVRRWDDVI